MKLMKNIFVLILILFLGANGLYAQKGAIKKADKKFDKLAYIDAIATYERIANKGYKDQEMFKRLGDSYFFNAEYQDAAKWYGELINMGGDVESEYYFRYATSLKSLGDYKRADEMMAKFHKADSADTRGQLAQEQLDYLATIERNSKRYKIENVGINSQFMDYGSTLYGNQLIFTTSRDTMGLFKRKHTWNDQAFTTLYSATITGNGNLGKPERFAPELNTRYDEATPVFSKDGNYMYFTRSNYLKKKGKDSQGTTLLKVFRAEKVDGKWRNVTELPFNSDEYSVAHPALSPDEKYLYFASNMPGTLGSSDIYRVEISGNHSSYGTPENLGAPVNTEGRDTFPYIDEEGNLYFSSDGHPGLGGLDVFKSFPEEDNFGDPVNVGKPINSKFDDFGFYKIPGTKNGFFTSNRKEDNKGFDDIYKFTEYEELIKGCDQELAGVVLDAQTQEPIPFAKVTLKDSNFNELNVMEADAEGRYDFGSVDCNKKYYVKAEKEGYEVKEDNVTIPNMSGKTEFPVALMPRVQEFVPGQNIGDALKVWDENQKKWRLPIIYFDLDKSFIRPDAAFELEKVLDIMTQNPGMHIDVRSHTDCRATMAYNDRLSNSRAKETVAWLVKNGIAKNRLTGKGYGERQLVNECACEPTNDSPCSDDEHQLNRRSEFIITKL